MARQAVDAFRSAFIQRSMWRSGLTVQKLVQVLLLTAHSNACSNARSNAVLMMHSCLRVHHGMLQCCHRAFANFSALLATLPSLVIMQQRWVICEFKLPFLYIRVGETLGGSSLPPNLGSGHTGPSWSRS
eukprot:1152669-Pelagomonas_calceolata.AAC.3